MCCCINVGCCIFPAYKLVWVCRDGRKMNRNYAVDIGEHDNWFSWSFEVMEDNNLFMLCWYGFLCVTFECIGTKCGICLMRWANCWELVQ